MNKRKTKYEYNMSVPEQRTNESDEAYYNRLRLLANKRLDKIEGYVKDQHFQNMDKYAYAAAMYDIHSTRTAEGKWARADRFIAVSKLARTEDGTVDRRTLHAATNDVLKFLNAPTSTKSGLIQIYKKRADTINRNMGLKGRSKLSWEELAKYYESGQSEKDKEYGSSTVMKAMGAIKRISSDPEKIKAAAVGDIRVAKDDAVNEIAQRMLANGIEDIFK